MTSLVVLMIEEEQPEGLSSRKLVVETEKHNVLTAYTPENGLDLLRRFPNVNAVLIHSAVLTKQHGLIAEIRSVAPKVAIILASPLSNESRSDVDFVVDSHRPQDLLNLIRREFHTGQ